VKEPYNGGPAFPFSLISGMTLRDYFAAKAMAAMAPLKWDAAYSQNDRGRGQPEADARWVAIAAYRYADAMLAERAKPR